MDQPNTSSPKKLPILFDATHPVDFTSPTTDRLSYSRIQRPFNSKDSLKDKFRVKGLAQASRVKKLFFIIAIFFFISFNVGVNSYSAIGNLGDLLPPSLLITTILVTGLATIFSNSLSKFTEIGRAVDALKLNSEQQTFFDNLENALDRTTNFTGKHIICLDHNDQSIFRADGEDTRDLPPKMVSALQLLQEKYYDETGNELTIVSNLEFQDYYESTHKEKNFIVIKDCDIDKGRYAARHTFIDFYHHGWTARLANDFLSAPLTQGIPTLVKAGLSLVRWSVTMGAPSFVVTLTGIHALSKIMGTETLTPLQRLLLLAVNSTISAAKTMINYDLKQKLTDLECCRILESIRHLQPININCKNASLSLLVSSLSMFPYVLVTSFFYAAKGPSTFLKEINAITGLELGLTEVFSDLITYLAVITSLPTAAATTTLSFYRILEKGLTNGDTQAQESLRTYYKTTFFLHLASVIDSMACGVNANFNSHESMEILITRYPACANILSSTTLRKLIADTTGSGVALLALFWCYYKGMKKFKNNMEVIKVMKKSVGKFFQANRAQIAPNQKLDEPLLGDGPPV